MVFKFKHIIHYLSLLNELWHLQTLVNELTAEGFSKIHCLGELLEEIKRNEYASDDMIGECVQAFELVESSFRGFCIEMEDLHKCTVSDADHLMRCGKTIVEVSQWLQSERLTMEGFRDISEVEEQLRRALVRHKINYDVTKLLTDY